MPDIVKEDFDDEPPSEKGSNKSLIFSDSNKKLKLKPIKAMDGITEKDSV